MVATERKRQGEIATAGCYSACYITLRNILILSVFFFLPTLPLLIARKHFFISFPPSSSPPSFLCIWLRAHKKIAALAITEGKKASTHLQRLSR